MDADKLKGEWEKLLRGVMGGAKGEELGADMRRNAAAAFTAFSSKFQLVSRSEFDALRKSLEMAIKKLDRIEAQLEKAAARKKPPAKAAKKKAAPTRKKPAAKKPARKPNAN